MAHTPQLDLEAALRRARTRQKIVELLATLSPTERLDLLADLLAAIGSTEVPNGVPPQALSAAETSSLSVVADAGGEPEEEQSYREAVLAALAEKPRRPVSELAVAAYGEANKVTIGRVRSILTVLKKRGAVNNPSFGKWVIKKRKEAVDS